MSLRLGVDLDGTVADLSSAFHQMEQRLFGEESVGAVSEVDEGEPVAAPATDKERLKQAKDQTRRTKQVWRAIQDTNDFWMTLSEIEPGAVKHLNDTARRLGWEVFFITQRPETAGSPVQWQSQQWLAAQGFVLPSVLTLRGSRGRAAKALDLDFLIDDLARNCVDVVADSKCRPFLVQREGDNTAGAAAQRMHISVVKSVRNAVDLLATPTPQPRETAVSRVLRQLGLSR